MPKLILLLFIPALLLNVTCYATEQKVLEQSLHQYYQLNININRYWKDDTNLKNKQSTERTLELMNQAMAELLNKKYPATEYQEISKNWEKVSKLIDDTSLIEQGYADVSLIASYRVYLDNVRQAMLKRYQENPPTSDIANSLILFDRIISTYVEVNTDAFGSFIRSANDEDMDLTKIAEQIDENLIVFQQSNSISKTDLYAIKIKWKFIRNVITSNNGQASPFIVLLNGNKIIQILESYY